jgi:hypothetical protein
MSVSTYSTSGYNWKSTFKKLHISSTTPFWVIILGALLAFEMFNYSTTEYALKDLLGELKFNGMLWSTILAIAFCGIDFAGIARLFTPQQGTEEPKEVWYLFGAWLLAATMNAILTWWGVSMAIATHTVRSSAVIDAQTITKVVPVFVAVMVWVIRILIIGSISVAGDHLINRRDYRASDGYRPRPVTTPGLSTGSSLGSLAPTPRPVMNRSASSPISVSRPSQPEINPPANPNLAQGGLIRPEPTYHSLNASARPAASIQAPSGDRPVSGRKIG